MSEENSLVNRYAIPTLAMFLLGQAIAGVIWGSRLTSRVDTIEQRGSPSIDRISQEIAILKLQHADFERRVPILEIAVNRLNIIEERQRIVIDTVRINGDKIDSITQKLNDLRK